LACAVTIWFLLVAGASAAPRLLVVGDSLSAAYGIPADQGWVQLLQQRLAAGGYPHQVVNASISGDTTRGGLTRLPAALERHQPALVVLELGGNDGLRGFGPAMTRDHLQQMIDLATDAGARVLVLGVKLPANYGSAYGDKFHQVFLDLAEQPDVAVVPFFLEGVAEDRALMQPDGIHPSAAAQPRILENVWSALQPLLSPAQG
jgi:acyl-CoA thioesterase-1